MIFSPKYPTYVARKETRMYINSLYIILNSIWVLLEYFEFSRGKITVKITLPLPSQYRYRNEGDRKKFTYVNL